jgi:hypothetical protein
MGRAQMRCARCHGVIIASTRGRPKRFCSDACRLAAARRRQQGVPEDLELDATCNQGEGLTMAAWWNGPGKMASR